MLVFCNDVIAGNGGKMSARCVVPGARGVDVAEAGSKPGICKLTGQRVSFQFLITDTESVCKTSITAMVRSLDFKIAARRVLNLLRDDRHDQI